MARPLFNLLKKDVQWCWTSTENNAFDANKDSLFHTPIFSMPNPDRAFSVFCDSSDIAIGSDLLQTDIDGRERVIAIESRLLKAAEKTYPVHDKELIPMKYYFVKFRVHLLGSKPIVIYTDHASYALRPRSLTSLIEWLVGFPSLPNKTSR